MASRPTRTDIRSTKRCPKCAEIKEATEFVRAIKRKDGLSSWCKRCRADNTKKWNADNPEKRAANIKRMRYRRKHKRNRLDRAARYFEGRPGWERIVLSLLTSDSNYSSHCYCSQPLENLYQKYTEESWDDTSST
jgi:hypothetical protein